MGAGAALYIQEGKIVIYNCSFTDNTIVMSQGFGVAICIIDRRLLVMVRVSVYVTATV